MPSTKRYDLWTHGVQTQVQQYDRVNDPGLAAVRIRRNSSGTTIVKRRDDGEVKGFWCHIAVPTPTMLENDRTDSERYYLKGHVNGQATVRKIHIYQGGERVHQADGLSLSDRNLDEELVLPERDRDVGVVWFNPVRGPAVLCIYIELEDGGRAIISGAAGTFVGV